MYCLEKISSGCKSLLTRSLVLGLALGTAGYLMQEPVAHGEDDVDIDSTGTILFAYNNQPFANVFFFTKGKIPYDGGESVSLRPYTYDELQGMDQGFGYWYQAIGAPKAGIPAIAAIYLDKNELNAAAISPASDGYTALAKYFLGGNIDSSSMAAQIYTNSPEGYSHFSFAPYQNLTSQSAFTPYESVIIHEMFHALGVLTNAGLKAYITIDDTPDKAEFATKNKINPELLTGYDRGLYDYRGKALRDCTYVQIVAAKPDSPRDDVFYIINSSNSGVYYTGDNVKRVLTLNGETAKLAWANGADLEPVVGGLPINGTDGAKDILELSHFELQNSLQSHQSFRNYGVPMEVELAFMQDLGYSIDPSRFYGKSIYNSGTKEQPFTYINTSSYQQDQQAGVGLHVYGSYVDVQQNADIAANGYGALGIRVDGAGNRLTVNNSVAANGDMGRGINISYGSNHSLNINSSVEALGSKGIAVGFDFGTGVLGMNKQINRGSYINYYLELEAEAAGTAAKIIPVTMPEAIKGPLVGNANINGTLAGQLAAIYISPNALVKNINLGSGAFLQGDIISEWDNSILHQSCLVPEAERLKVKRADGTVVDAYIPGYYDAAGELQSIIQLPEGEDGMTSLNFGATADNQAGDPGFSMSYNGNILDFYNTLNMRVRGGSLNYGGTAYVNSVQVDKGASLFGGSYYLQEKDGNYNGALVNNGTIGAAMPKVGADSYMAINGNLELKHGSSIRLTANNDAIGKIWAQNVTIDDGTQLQLSVDPQGKYRLGSYEGLANRLVAAGEAQTSVALNFQNTEGDKLYESGLMSGRYHGAEDSSVEFTVENNLGQLAGPQAQSFEAVSFMAGNPANQGELQNLLSLPAEQAGTALEEIAGQANAQVAAVPQQSTLTGRLIAGRLASVNHSTINLSLPILSSSLVDTANPVKTEGQPAEASDGAAAERSTKEMPFINVKVPVEPDYSMWAKIDKGWGSVGGSFLHSYSMALGWDKQYDSCNRFGTMLAFTSTGFSGNGTSDNAQDYRLGFYNGYHKGPHDMMAYLDFGLQRHKVLRHMPTMGLQTSSEYGGRLVELGVEYKYDLHAQDGRTFHVAPYMGAQLSRYWQDSYREQGAGIFDQQVHSLQNNYAASEVGLEISRFMGQGSWTGRLGYRHIWAGANPLLTYNYAGDTAHSWSSSSQQDRDFITASLSGTAYLGGGWSLDGEARIAKGRHDKDYGLSLMVKYQW